MCSRAHPPRLLAFSLEANAVDFRKDEQQKNVTLHVNRTYVTTILVIRTTVMVVFIMHVRLLMCTYYLLLQVWGLGLVLYRLFTAGQDLFADDMDSDTLDAWKVRLPTRSHSC